MPETAIDTPEHYAVEQLLTAQEVRDLLRISPATWHRLGVAARIGPVRLANRERFRPSDVETFIESQRSGASP